MFHKLECLQYHMECTLASTGGGVDSPVVIETVEQVIVISFLESAVIIVRLLGTSLKDSANHV